MHAFCVQIPFWSTKDLVYSKGRLIMNEFNSLLQDDAIHDERRWGPLWPAATTEEEKATLRSELVLCITETIADFSVRILDKLEKFPLLLAWMIYREPAIECDRRRAVAQKLQEELRLGTLVDDMSFKMAEHFPSHFQHVADTGNLYE